MAIPDTNTFSLQDVADYPDFSKQNPNDLIACFSAANVNGNLFDPNYEGDRDELYNFRNYDGPWVGRLMTVANVTTSSSNSWSSRSNAVSSDLIGHDVKVVWKYTSGSTWSSDFQIGGNLTLFGTTFDLDTYSGTPFQTTRVDTSSYSNAVFYDIATGTTPMRFNKRSTSGTPSGGTGVVPSPPSPGDNTYYYAEASAGSPSGNPGKDFWLRSPTVSVTANNLDIDYWVGFYGAAMGPGWSVYVEVIT